MFSISNNLSHIICFVQTIINIVLTTKYAFYYFEGGDDIPNLSFPPGLMVTST